MNHPVYLIGGGKGGVGKSIVSMALIDYLKSQGEEVLLIETDTSNPDVYKSYKDNTVASLVNLDESGGWIELINLCDANPQCVVVINTAARSADGVGKYGETLGQTLVELKRDLITYWVINRQRDSLELLKEYMEVMPGKVHVVRNGYFGEEKKFELYGISKLKLAVEARDGKSVTFPDLADRVIDDLYIQRLTIEDAVKTLPIGNRAELLRWRGECKKILTEITNE